MDDEYCKDILEIHLHRTEQNQYSIIHKLSIFLKEGSFKNLNFGLSAKKSFYRYAAFLAFLNLAQAIGSGMLYGEIQEGMW